MNAQQSELFDLLDGFEMTKSQHDWLEQRFENMTVKEKLLFRGALQIEHPQMTADVMLIANQLDHYDLFYGAGDDARLGKFVMEQIQRPSSQARAFIDPEKVGTAYRQKGGNTFCDGHFIKVTSLIDPFLDGDPTLNPDKGDYGIRVKLASRSNTEGVWVGFPDTGEYMDTAHPDELLLALDALEVESLTECIAVDVDCCLPQLEDILSQYSSAAELVRHAIDFGYAWGEQGQGEPRWLDKWQAVMELEDCHRLDYALDLAQNLHCYHFMPRDMELTDFGKTLAKQDGVYPKDELLASCFDAESYPEAVTMLLGGEAGTIYPSAAERVEEPPKPFVLPPIHSDMRRVYAYLVKHRNIDRSVVAHFAREKLLYEDAEYHNAVFVGTDEEGIPRHAHKRSTNSYGKAFRLNVEGCDPHYSFHHIGTDERLYVFEAPIDMLSYITLYPEDWQRHSYVACCGTSILPVMKMLERMPQIHTVLLCLDNDEAGRLANQRMTEQLAEKYAVEQLVPENKDWNDDLTAIREQECEVKVSCQSFG